VPPSSRCHIESPSPEYSTQLPFSPVQVWPFSPVQVWPYLLGYYKFGASAADCAAQDEASRSQYENTVSEWLAVEAIVTQCDRDALEENIARLSAEHGAGAVSSAAGGGGSSAEEIVRAAAARMEVEADGNDDDPDAAHVEEERGRGSVAV